jgi:hypothetical protein
MNDNSQKIRFFQASHSGFRLCTGGAMTAADL